MKVVPQAFPPECSRRADGLLTIGELAKETHCTARTIRFYEEQDLIRPARRSPGRYRLYSREQVARLELIARLKAVGLSLRDIRDMLRAREDGSQVKSVAESLAARLFTQLMEAERKIRLYREAKKDFEETLKLLETCKICELPTPCEECDVVHTEGRPAPVFEAILS